MPHRKQGSHLLLKTVLCCNWATRGPEGVIFDVPNHDNRLPNDSCTLKKKYRLYPDQVFYVFFRCRMYNLPVFPTLNILGLIQVAIQGI